MNRPNADAEYDRFKQRKILQSIFRNLIWNSSCSKCKKRLMPNTNNPDYVPIEDLGEYLLESDSSRINPNNETILVEHLQLESKNKLAYVDIDIVDEKNNPVVKPLRILKPNPTEIKIMLTCKNVNVDEPWETCGHENLYPFTEELAGIKPDNFFNSIKFD